LGKFEQKTTGVHKELYNFYYSNKYNRHPVLIPIGQAPIITCIDSYSKYLVVKEIQNKLHIETKIAEILQHFPLAKTLMTDNEPSFTSTQFKSFAQRCGINFHFADPRHSTSN